MRVARGLWLVGLTVLMGACAETVVPPAELTTFKPAVKVAVAWKTGVGDSGPYEFAPAIWEGDYFAADTEGRLARIDGSNGRRKWRIDTKEVLSGGVGAQGGLVLVGTARGEVLAYDTTGKALWRTTVSSEVLSPPSVADGIVVVRSGDGRIVGLDAATGVRNWEYLPTLPPLTLRVTSGVAVRDGTVFAGFAGGKMVALRVSNGTLLWEVTVAQPRGETELERVTDVVGVPLVEEGQVCAIAYQGRVGCFDAARGALTWARNASSVSGLAADQTAFYYVDDGASIFAVDRSSGASLWKQDILARRNLGAPGRIGQYIIVGDFEGYVHVFDREDGRLAGRVSTDGGPISAAPIPVADGKFVVQTREGNLYAMTLR
jgi:outer membrane protein assembly factor BamB